MNGRWLLLVFLLIGSDAFADDINWYRVSANTLLVADWLQTREGVTDEMFYEDNSILGKYPSQSDINKYFAASILLTNIVGELLPDEYSNYFYLTVAVVQAKTVIGNYTVGVRVSF